MLHRLIVVLAILGFVLVAVTIVSEVDTALGLFAIPAAGFFVALAIAPYALLAALARRIEARAALVLCALALAGLSVFWIWAFGSVFWWNAEPDAQDGLALLVFPALMVSAAGAVALVAWLIDRARSPSPADRADGT